MWVLKLLEVKEAKQLFFQSRSTYANSLTLKGKKVNIRSKIKIVLLMYDLNLHSY